MPALASGSLYFGSPWFAFLFALLHVACVSPPFYPLRCTGRFADHEKQRGSTPKTPTVRPCLLRLIWRFEEKGITPNPTEDDSTRGATTLGMQLHPVRLLRNRAETQHRKRYRSATNRHDHIPHLTNKASRSGAEQYDIGPTGIDTTNTTHPALALFSSPPPFRKVAHRCRSLHSPRSKPWTRAGCQGTKRRRAQPAQDIKSGLPRPVERVRSPPTRLRSSYSRQIASLLVRRCAAKNSRGRIDLIWAAHSGQDPQYPDNEVRLAIRVGDGRTR